MAQAVGREDGLVMSRARRISMCDSRPHTLLLAVPHRLAERTGWRGTRRTRQSRERGLCSSRRHPGRARRVKCHLGWLSGPFSSNGRAEGVLSASIGQANSRASSPIWTPRAFADLTTPPGPFCYANSLGVRYGRVGIGLGPLWGQRAPPSDVLAKSPCSRLSLEHVEVQ